MANGFQTSRPARHGTDPCGNSEANSCRAERFVMPGTNGVTYELTEIGLYGDSDSGQTCNFHLGVFDDDGGGSGAAHPTTIVANSDSGQIQIVNDTTTKVWPVTYAGTKPLVVGATTYWIGMMIDSTYLDFDKYVTGITSGDSIRITSGITYPTWPADAAAWHTHTDLGTDYGIYVIYQAIASGVYADRWHPEIQQPIREKIEVIGY